MLSEAELADLMRFKKQQKDKPGQAKQQASPAAGPGKASYSGSGGYSPPSPAGGAGRAHAPGETGGRAPVGGIYASGVSGGTAPGRQAPGGGINALGASGGTASGGGAPSVDPFGFHKHEAAYADPQAPGSPGTVDIDDSEFSHISSSQNSVFEDLSIFFTDNFFDIFFLNCVVIALAVGLSYLSIMPISRLIFWILGKSMLAIFAATITAVIVPAIFLILKLWLCESIAAVMVSRRQFNRNGGGTDTLDLCFDRAGAIITTGIAQVLILYGLTTIALLPVSFVFFVLGLHTLGTIMFLVVVIMTIWFQNSWSLAGMVAVLEDKWSTSALARSNQLVSEGFWWVALYRFLFSLLAAAAIYVFNLITVPLVGPEPRDAFFKILNFCFTVGREALSLSVVTVCMAVIYHHLERRNPSKILSI